MKSRDDDLDYVLGDGPTVYTLEDIYQQLNDTNHELREANRYLAAISGGVTSMVYALLVGALAYIATHLKGWFWP